MIPSIKKLFRIFNKKEKVFIAILFVASITSALAQSIGVVSVLPFINLVTNPEIVEQPGIIKTFYETFNIPSFNRLLVYLGLAVLLALTISSVISAFTMYLKARFVANRNHSLSIRLLQTYLYKPYGFFLKKNTSELSKNVLAEVNDLTQKYLMSILNILTNGFLLLFILIALLLVNTTATLYVFLMLVVTYGILNLYTRKTLKKMGSQRLSYNALRHKYAHEALSSIKISKVMSNEKFFIDSYSKASKKQAKTLIASNVIGQLPNYALDLIVFGGVILFIVILILNNQDFNQVIPLLGVFALAGYRMKPSLNTLYQSITTVYYNQAILDKIHDDLLEQQINEHIDDPHVKLPLHKHIKLKNLSFAYPDSNEVVVDRINITVEKDQMIGIVGKTGSGKTTLIDLVLGLHSPSDGSIEIDDTILTSENIKSWQNNIGYVPQDTYLSDDSIANNIAFGLDNKHIDIDRVVDCAKMCALDEFIESLPQKYHTVIGERGVRLSGGQKQRIGLARAIYRDPQVLILDEATSAIDGITESEVLHTITHVSKSKTVIVIAHRLNTLKDCDVIYMVDKGKVIAHGTYQQLLENNQEFKKMAKA